MRVLCRCYQTLGCDGVIIICPELHHLIRLTRRLRRILPPQSTDRVAFMTQNALEMLMARSTLKPSIK